MGDLSAPIMGLEATAFIMFQNLLLSDWHMLTHNSFIGLTLLLSSQFLDEEIEAWEVKQVTQSNSVCKNWSVMEAQALWFDAYRLNHKAT